MSGSQSPTRSHYLALSCISAALLNYEILLTRFISVQHWHHFAALIIAIALLGFGAGSSVVALFSSRKAMVHQFWRRIAVFVTWLAIPLSLWLANQIPLNMLALPWQSKQLVYLLLYACCFVFPFFTAAIFVILNFIQWPLQIGRIYAADLAGSASGALLALLCLRFLPIESGFWISMLLVGFAFVLLLPRYSTVMLVFLTQLGFWLSPGLLAVNPTAFKPLSVTLSIADARILFQIESEQSRLTLVDSPGQHSAPGLSIMSASSAPEQYQLFFDGTAPVPMLVNDFQTRKNDIFSQTLGALPFQLLSPDSSVLLLGGNFSWQAWSAHWHQAAQITIADENPLLLSLLKGGQTDQSFLPPQIQLKPLQSRRFLSTTDQTFDLIQVEVADYPVGGADAQVSYLYTTESILALLQHLSPEGVLVFSGQLKAYPQDSIRLLRSLISVLTDQGLDSGQHILSARDWQNYLLVVSKHSLTPQVLDRLTQWSIQWRFDLEYSGSRDQNSQDFFHQQQNDYYSRAFQQLLANAPESIDFDYPYRLEATNDNRPYFYHFFRWTSPEWIRGQIGSQWLLYVGWGYLLHVATLPLVLLLASVLIFGPLLSLRLKEQLPTKGFLFGYFAAIGLAFMFMEIALLHRSILFLDSISSAFAITLTALLGGAALGSQLYAKLGDRRLNPTYLAIIMVAMILLTGLLTQASYDLILGFSWLPRVSLVLVMILLLAVPAGFFFPLGIHRLASGRSGAIAWSWAINGFFSVFGALIAPLIAMETGLNVLGYLAALGYLLAIIWLYSVRRIKQ